MHPLTRAHIALEGLSVGDALGDLVYFHPHLPHERPTLHHLPPAPWRTTDDTQFAASAVAVLDRDEALSSDALAAHLTAHMDTSYGTPPEVEHLIGLLRGGAPWPDVAGQPDADGITAVPHAAAARAIPIGAYYAEDMNRALTAARDAVRITHTTPEALHIAMALAAAAAVATRWGGSPQPTEWHSFLANIIRTLPACTLRDRLDAARTLPDNLPTAQVAKQLEGDVTFALWAAARWLDNYPEALWQATSVGGDTPALGAMVGGIVGCYVGIGGIPAHWRRARSRLPLWSGIT